MSGGEKGGSRLPIVLHPLGNAYAKPERRNDLVPPESYDKIDEATESQVKLGTDGVAYVSENAFPVLFDVSKAKGTYIFENQIPDSAKCEFNGESYAHSGSVVGLLHEKAQETRNADTQAKLQYGRDSVINAADSDRAQDLRRKCDTFTQRELAKLRVARGGNVDELTGEPLRPGAAFHHVYPRELHTSPIDALDPGKGRLLNRETHAEVHREGLYDERMFEEYKNKKGKS